MKDFYVSAPMGGGIHFFSHLARLHIYGDDPYTFHCPTFNEYTAPTEEPDMIWTDRDNRENKEDRFMRFNWDINSKRWMRPKDIERKDYRVIPAHDYKSLDRGQQGIAIFPKHFSTYILHKKLAWIKREFGTSLQSNNMRFIKALKPEYIDRYDEYINVLKSFDVDINPCSRRPLKTFLSYCMKNKPFDANSLHKSLAITLVPYSGNPDDHKRYKRSIDDIKGGVPPYITRVWYDDLLEGEPTHTFLDDFTDNVLTYHEDNIKLIEKYEDWATQSI